MRRLSRFFTALLSLSLVLAAPGFAPYQAAAQTMAARVAAPAGQSGVAGAALAGPAGLGPRLSEASLQTGLTPSLSASLAPAPIQPAPAGLTFAARPVPAVLIRPIALKSAPVRALASLENGANALAAEARAAPAGVPQAALDGLFDGEAARPGALAVAGRSAASDSPRLAPPDARGPVEGPRWVKNVLAPRNVPPATSIMRTLSVGFLGAIIPLAITNGLVSLALSRGYQFHANYAAPGAGLAPTAMTAIALAVAGAVMAPAAEEPLFRAVVQGGLAGLSAKLRLSSFIARLAPMVIAAGIFVAVHETSDPLLMATRFIQALILGHIFKKEGILASMTAHGIFNGLLALPELISLAGVPALAQMTAPLTICASLMSYFILRSQRLAVASGALVPKPLTAKIAFLFAAMLMFGYYFIMANYYWPLGALALILAGHRLNSKNS